MSGRVLIVDDDPMILRLVSLKLLEDGIETVTARTGTEALRRVREDNPAAVVLDLDLPDTSGKEVLRIAQRERPGLPIVMLTATSGVDEVVACMRLGAADYVHKPFDATRLLTSVRNALERGELRARVESLANELRASDGLGALIGDSPAMRRAVALLARAATSDVTVLLEAESGTGKEVAARAVHAESARRTAPLVVVNCGAIPETLIESELFGHEKGAFTGATARRAGRFEEAKGGTIFLDEVGELPLSLQVRLLRVLQDRTIQRVGGSGTERVDVRVIAATNRDLKAEVARHAFREDLYYRLAVFPLTLPPLRERQSDVWLLAETFLKRFAARHRRRIGGFTLEARQSLEAHAWPGNVRELENVIERAVIVEDGPQISLGALPDGIVTASMAGKACGPALAPVPAPARPSGQTGGAPEQATDDILPFDEEERRIVLRALERTGWNVLEAARRLEIGQATIYRKIEKYGLRSQQPAGTKP